MQQLSISLPPEKVPHFGQTPLGVSGKDAEQQAWRATIYSLDSNMDERVSKEIRQTRKKRGKRERNLTEEKKARKL